MFSIFSPIILSFLTKFSLFDFLANQFKGDTIIIEIDLRTSKDGSIRHSGDNRTGAGDGDDEVISVDLSRVPPQIKSLIFTVNSFRGQTFEKVQNAFCRLINAQNNQEVARFNLSCQGSHTALIVAKLYRHNGEWKMHAIGDNTNGRTFHDMMPQLVALV